MNTLMRIEASTSVHGMKKEVIVQWVLSVTSYTLNKKEKINDENN